MLHVHGSLVIHLVTTTLSNVEHENRLSYILRHNWHLLTNNKIVVLSHFVAPEAEVSPERKGTVRCNKCPQCPWVCEGEVFTLPSGEIVTCRHHADCQTLGAIYLNVQI